VNIKYEISLTFSTNYDKIKIERWPLGRGRKNGKGKPKRRSRALKAHVITSEAGIEKKRKEKREEKEQNKRKRD